MIFLERDDTVKMNCRLKMNTDRVNTGRFRSRQRYRPAPVKGEEAGAFRQCDAAEAGKRSRFPRIESNALVPCCATSKSDGEARYARAKKATVFTVIRSNFHQNSPMKRIPFLLAVLSIQLASASDTIKPLSFADTCAWIFIPNEGFVPDLVTYKTPLGGYVCGNSVLHTPEKAQKYYGTDSAKTLTAIAFWFGQKIQSSAPGQIKAKVYRVNPVTGAPADLIAESLAKPVHAVDTSDNLTVLNLANPVALPDTFFVALDVSLLAPGDSVGLLSTRDNCFSGEQLAWEKDSTGAWVPFNDGTSITSWGLDIDMAIFPVGDFGLHTRAEMIPSTSVSVFPNPAGEKLFIRSDGRPAGISISDLSGRLMHSVHVDYSTPEIEMDISSLCSGIYFLEIRNENFRAVRKIVIAD